MSCRLKNRLLFRLRSVRRRCFGEESPPRPRRPAVKGVVIGLLLSLACAGSLPGQDEHDAAKIRGTNPGYRQGDWISYTMTRFVTSAGIGPNYVYFGTTGGIIRYDYFANQWDFPFTTSSGLADNYVTVVAFDMTTNILWCGTKTAISNYHESSQRWSNVFKDESGISPYDAVVSIGFGRTMTFFETSSGLLYRSDRYGGPVFIASRADVLRDGPVTWNGWRAVRSFRFPNYHMSDGYFFNLDGYIQDTRLRRAKVTAVINDKWQNSWLGTWGFGAMRGDLRSEFLTMMPYGLYSPHVRAIAIDENGVWFAGKNENLNPAEDIGRAGVTYWNQVSGEWRYYESKFDANFLTDNINRLHVYGDSLFCATRFGVNILDTDNGDWYRLTAADGLLHDNINDLLLQGSQLFVATDAGLNRIDLKRSRSDTLRMATLAGDDLNLVRVFDIALKDDLLWAATEFGLYLYNTIDGRGAFVQSSDGPIGEVVISLSLFGDELWMGTVSAVYALDLQQNRWLQQPEKNLGINYPVRSIVATEGQVWVGTDGGGLFKLNRETRDWVRFTREDGLLNNHVLEIREDGDYLWLGTPEGVTLFYWNDPNRID